jgi:hypothetical protein
MTGITRPHYLIDTVAAVARLNDDEAIIKLISSRPLIRAIQ